MKHRAFTLFALCMVIAIGVLPAAAAPIPGKTGHVTPGATPAPMPDVSVLWNQYDNQSLNATSSQNFEAANDAFDDFLADDFVVSAAHGWGIAAADVDGVYFNCTSCGPATSFNVTFYRDSNGLPGTAVAQAPNSRYRLVGTSTFRIILSHAAALANGHYWMSVQANLDFGLGGQWGWTDRSVANGSDAAWENPGGGFAICPTWGDRNTTCGIDPGVPDQVFRLDRKSVV